MATHEETENHVDELRREVSELKTCVSEMRDSMKDLLSAWQAAGVFVGIIKWVASIASGAAVIWAMIHGKDINK